MNTIKKSEIKLQEFNDCLGLEKTIDLMKDYGLYEKIHFIDTNIEYWTNDNDCMVFYIDKNTNAVNFSKFISELRPDEYHTKKIDNKTIIRIWFD